MTLIEARNAFRSKLASLYTRGEIDDLFKRFIRHAFHWDSVKIALESNYDLSSSELDQLNAALKALQNATPLQYILKQSHFYGLDFQVDSNVLIPRPETEELVEWILEENSETLSLLDLGTGSGCIALTLKHHRPLWNIKGIDVSTHALKTAQKNADLQSLKVDFLEMDILGTAVHKINKQDILVSNPPYVLPSERKNMHPNVLEHEPETALFVPEKDPLLFYRNILEKGKVMLKPGGRIYFEINPLNCDELVALCQKEGYREVEVRCDIFQKKRMLKMTLVK